MEAPRLEIGTEARPAEGGDLAFVRVSGEIDLANADRVSSALASPQALGAVGVVLDLTQVSFIDSSGLAALLNARKQLDGRLAVVVGPGSAVSRLFETAGVGRHLRVVEDEASALAETDAES
jgi:anti-sigma B factor antagonist